jgi:hypothetical protein
MKFTFCFDQPNTKTVIALAVFVQLQEAMEAKVVYLNEDVRENNFITFLFGWSY